MVVSKTGSKVKRIRKRWDKEPNDRALWTIEFLGVLENGLARRRRLDQIHEKWDRRHARSADFQTVSRIARDVGHDGEVRWKGM
jgi:hypothetical protein